jgi:integrase
MRLPTALTADELRGLHQWLSSDKQSVERNLPDLVLFLIATGLRIGEALAVQWANLGLEDESRGVATALYGGRINLPARRGLIITLCGTHLARADPVTRGF